MYRIGTWNGKTGFWRCIRGRDLELLLEGNCAFPVVTPDGKWAVVAKADDSWAEPNHLFLVDLARRKVTRVNVPAADTFNPVAYVPAHRKILLLRARDTELGTDTDRAPVGPSQPEFRLLDPATGHTEVVSGEFEPLVSQSIRPLQPTGRPNEVWAARFNSTCEIGRYDTKAFTFHSVLSLPAMRFSSMQMWIEEAESWIYVAYNGHLLRMALPKE